MEPKVYTETITEDEEFNKVQSKMKYLCKFILELFTVEIDKYKSVLDKKYSTTEFNSSILSAAEKSLTGNIPKSVVKIGSALYKGTENNQVRDFAKRLNKTIYYYDQKKEECQKILIEAGIKIFIAYEFQFNNCYVDSHDETRALKKIAYDIVMKIINNLNATTDLSVRMIIKSVLESEWSLQKRFRNIVENKRKEIRTVILEYVTANSNTVKLETETNDIFLKPGLRVKKDNNYLFYTKKNCEPLSYGYRNCFDGEIINSTYVTVAEDNICNYSDKLSSINITELINKYFEDFSYNIHEDILQKVTKLTQNQDQNVANKPLKPNETDNGPYIFGIKEQVFNFVGREYYLATIDKYLFQTKKKKIIVVGMPGIGKSELLKKYASDNLFTKYHNTIWINADNEEAIKTSFTEIAKLMEIRQHITVDMGDVSSLLRAVFLKLRETCISANKETLLIYDNVENYTMIKPYLPFKKEFEDGLINILITSRKIQWDPQFDVLYLDKISEEESLTLINETIKKEKRLVQILKDNQNLAHEVIKINEGLPLALQQAIAYIVEEEKMGTDNPFKVYLTNYTIVLDKLYDDGRPLPDYLGIEYPNTLYVTYKMILEKLKANNKTITLMQICSFLDPNGVNKFLLYNFLNQDDVKHSIRILENYSLMKTVDNFVIVHRLVLAITRILYLREKSNNAFTDILKFNLRFNYLIQLNSVTLVTSEQFFIFLRSVYSTFIYQYIDENTEEVKKLYKTLSDAEKVRLFLLLVYHGCTETVISISEREEENYPKSFMQCFNINEISNKMKEVSELFTEQDDKILRWLDKKKYAGSALNIAGIEGHKNISKYFIRKITVNNTNPVFYTNRFNMPLIHCVLHRQHDEIFKYLLENGANIKERDENGSTLLHVASSTGQYDIIQLLLNRNMQLDAKNKFGDTILHSCFYNHIYPKEQLKYLFTPITRENLSNDQFMKHDLCSYFKAITKHSSISMFTEDSGFADENKECIAIYYKYLNKKNHANHNKIIGEYGALAKLNTYNKYGLYPSHLQALSNNIIIKNDVRSAIEIHRMDNFGNDPLKYACANDCWDAVNSNIDNKIYISNENNFGFTILHSAACSGNRDMFKNVLKHYTNINKTDNNGCSVLHVALINKQYNLAKWLIDNNVDVNQTFEGVSALHLAAAAGQLEIIQKLLDRNAKINQQDDYGWSALHFIVTANLHKFENKNIQNVINNTKQKLDRMPKFFSERKMNNIDFNNEKIINIDNGLGEEKVIQSETSMECDFALKQFLKECRQDNFLDDSIIKPNPFSSLYVLSTQEQYEIIKLLILRHIDVNLVDIIKASCLHYACCFGHTHIAKQLLNAGIHIDTKAKKGWTALHAAAYGGHLATVELLLERGADIHVCDNYGTTTLHWSSERGHSDIVKKLLEKGADIEKKCIVGQTALHRAAYEGHLATVKLLLDTGADIHACTTYGTTALHLASRRGHSDVVKKLIGKDADLEKRDTEGQTALHRAAYEGHLSTVELLLDTGVDILACTNYGTTALHLASRRGNSDIVKKLIEKDANIEKKDKVGQTALHHAASEGHLATVELLLDTGADLHACATDGTTALHWAAEGGHSDLVQKLIEMGADIKKQDSEGQIPLHHAAYAGQLATVEMLLDVGADIHACANDGATALHLASEEGHSGLVKKLIEKGADIEKQDSKGQTALHRAAYVGHLVTVELLIDIGANINACANNGTTALRLALDEGHTNVVKKLTEKGADVKKQDQRFL